MTGSETKIYIIEVPLVPNFKMLSESKLNPNTGTDGVLFVADYLNHDDMRGSLSALAVGN